jgi:hypothetical protein
MLGKCADVAFLPVLFTRWRGQAGGCPPHACTLWQVGKSGKENGPVPVLALGDCLQPWCPLLSLKRFLPTVI